MFDLAYVKENFLQFSLKTLGERGGSVVECRTPEREVRGSRPTAAVLCPWARHFTPRKYWLITQEAMAPSRHDWKIVDWDVKPQHNQPTNLKNICLGWVLIRIASDIVKFRGLQGEVFGSNFGFPYNMFHTIVSLKRETFSPKLPSRLSPV